MSSRVMLPIADGSEEIEAVTVIDVLRRARCEVTLASVTGRLTITASRGTKLVADALIEDLPHDGWDAIVCPGGMPGAEALRDDPVLMDCLRKQLRSEGLVAAICAAPAVVLAETGLLGTRRATCHPSFAERIPNHVDEEVVGDGPVVTSQGPATAMAFALELVRRLKGETARRDLARALLYPS